MSQQNASPSPTQSDKEPGSGYVYCIRIPNLEFRCNGKKFYLVKIGHSGENLTEQAGWKNVAHRFQLLRNAWSAPCKPVIPAKDSRSFDASFSREEQPEENRTDVAFDYFGVAKPRVPSQKQNYLVRDRHQGEQPVFILIDLLLQPEHFWAYQLLPKLCNIFRNPTLEIPSTYCYDRKSGAV